MNLVLLKFFLFNIKLNYLRVQLYIEVIDVILPLLEFLNSLGSYLHSKYCSLSFFSSSSWNSSSDWTIETWSLEVFALFWYDLTYDLVALLASLSLLTWAQYRALKLLSSSILGLSNLLFFFLVSNLILLWALFFSKKISILYQNVSYS